MLLCSHHDRNLSVHTAYTNYSQQWQISCEELYSSCDINDQLVIRKSSNHIATVVSLLSTTSGVRAPILDYF